MRKKWLFKISIIFSFLFALLISSCIYSKDDFSIGNEITLDEIQGCYYIPEDKNSFEYHGVLTNCLSACIIDSVFFIGSQLYNFSEDNIVLPNDSNGSYEIIRKINPFRNDGIYNGSGYEKQNNDGIDSINISYEKYYISEVVGNDTTVITKEKLVIGWIELYKESTQICVE